MGVRQGKAGPASEIVGPPRRLRNHRHIARRALDVHSRKCYHRTRYDGVGPHLGPQAVGLPEKISEEVQGRAELLLARREATGELR